MTVRLRLLASVAAIAAISALAACAPAYPSPAGPVASLPAGQCFFPSTVTAFREDGASVNVRAGATDVYKVSLPARCEGLRGADRLLLDSRAGGASVCAGLDVSLILATADGPRRCPGQAIRKLSPQEVAALPPAARPNAPAPRPPA